MEIKAQAYVRSFGDNSVMDAFTNNQWGIRLDFLSKQQKHSFILTDKEAVELIKKIEESLVSIQTVQFKNPPAVS